MAEKLKLCKDCEYHKEVGSAKKKYPWAQHKCFAPENIVTDPTNLVTGEEESHFLWFCCQEARLDEMEDYSNCGPEARWFKEKEGDDS